MTMKRLLGWAALAFVVWFIIVQPTQAAHIVHNLGGFLTTVAHGLSTFFASL